MMAKQVRRLRYEYTAGGSNKFWEIEFADNARTFVTYWGRIGTAGMSKGKTYGSVRECNTARKVLVNWKIREGYELIGEVDAVDTEGKSHVIIKPTVVKKVGKATLHEYGSKPEIVREVAEQHEEPSYSPPKRRVRFRK
jgi:predicted DNA-binding WGR domain protein